MIVSVVSTMSIASTNFDLEVSFWNLQMALEFAERKREFKRFTTATAVSISFRNAPGRGDDRKADANFVRRPDT